ncbi:hypothetical protein NM688_g8706 [Phlebia brevispora]|uniref:Uncharacterized protein n=1 Tax=Phlebia brevispora TaxID=194682 RepID=A0ACC1RRH3_9APHY|nr:hypothetical protein NM688_g8706 [Phlebia brevispora]
MAVQAASSSLAPGASADSLDLKKLLVNAPREDLLAASLSFLSTISVAPSFSDVPSFPPHEASLPLFLNVISASSITEKETPTVTIPTSPRLKAMLMEPIVVDRWANTLPSDMSEIQEPESLPDSQPEIPISWIPEGHILPPETFSQLFRRGGNTRADESLGDDSSHDNIQANSLCVEVSYDGHQHHEDDPDRPCATKAINDDSDTALGVPTIMLSNSTAAVALSLESSQSLAPLAVRRGHKVPAPLTLSVSKNTEDGLYPGIPSPFLGSPSTPDPSTKFESSDDPIVSSLDLDAMCQDLRSRCPPLRPDSPFPSPQHMSFADTSSSAYTDQDSDEWAFAKEFLDKIGTAPFRPEPDVSKTPTLTLGAATPHSLTHPSLPSVLATRTRLPRPPQTWTFPSSSGGAPSSLRRRGTA